MKYLLAFLITFICICPANSQNIGEVRMTDCFLEDCSWVENSTGVEFGFITVPEDYQKPDGRLIKVAFSIIKARVENPKRDGLLYFQGGWGSPMIRSVKGFMNRFPIRDRDIILFDFRGTGFSEPALCTDLGLKVYEDIISDYSYSEFNEHQKNQINQCFDDLEAQQIDFLQYGSRNGMRDIRMLMDQLEYESYNLFGISYGTRRIQDLLRLSDKNVRSVVIDSNCPIGTGYTISGKMSKYYYDVLSTVLSDCESDAQCNLAFPNLKDRFEDFLKELKDKPLHVVSDEKDVFLNAVEVNGILHQLLYGRYYYADFPILLESLINRETAAISTIAEGMKTRVISNTNAVGVINYIADWNVYQQQAQDNYDHFIASAYMHYEVLDLYLHYFLDDDRFPVDSLNAIPVVSNVPTLIVSGTHDPITPPALSESLLPNFKNNFYYKFPREGHGPASSLCGENIWQQFINSPDSPPDDSCIVALGDNEIKFTTDYYKNDSIMSFVNGLTRSLNWWLIVGIGFIIVVSLINIIKAASKVVGKKIISNPWNSITSLLIILFFCGLGYFIYATANHEGPLMLFGLVKESNLLFYLVPLIFILIGVATVNSLKKKGNNSWDFISIGSYTAFMIVVFWFQLFPNV